MDERLQELIKISDALEANPPKDEDRPDILWYTISSKFVGPKNLKTKVNEINAS